MSKFDNRESLEKAKNHVPSAAHNKTPLRLFIEPPMDAAFADTLVASSPFHVKKTIAKWDLLTRACKPFN